MSINTPEKRRAAIDFGKGARGTGMPIPSGEVDRAARSHVLNLYPGIKPDNSFFFFWRNRTTPSTNFVNRQTPSTQWRSAEDADEDRFKKALSMRDE